MKLNDYQKLAARTLHSDLSKEEVGDMLTLGLIGETGEVSELIKKARFHGKPFNQTDLVAEVGDVLWYTAGEFTCSELEISVIGKTEFAEIDALVTARPLTDTEALCGVFGTIGGGDTAAAANRLCLLSRILQNNGSTLDEAAEKNIAKLQARYPDGFKKADA